MQKGYRATTTDDIAAKARVSKQTLYRLFPSKPALFAAVIEAHRQSMVALPGDYADIPVRQALELILRADISPRAHRERIALLRLLLSEMQLSPELLEVARQYGSDPSRKALTNWLTEQNKQGRLRMADPEFAAGALMDMTIGSVVLRMNIGRSAPSVREYADHVRECISLFLDGVLPR